MDDMLKRAVSWLNEARKVWAGQEVFIENTSGQSISFDATVTSYKKTDGVTKPRTETFRVKFVIDKQKWLAENIRLVPGLRIKWNDVEYEAILDSSSMWTFNDPYETDLVIHAARIDKDETDRTS
jgi:hypothetical protein